MNDSIIICIHVIFTETVYKEMPLKRHYYNYTAGITNLFYEREFLVIGYICHFVFFFHATAQWCIGSLLTGMVPSL